MGTRRRLLGRALDRGVAAGLLVILAAWSVAVTDALHRLRAARPASTWEAPRAYAGAVEIAGAVNRPGVRAGLAGARVLDALRAAGPRAAPRGPGLEARLEEGARLVLEGDGRVRRGRMPGRRLLTLGLRIPLDRATAADLEALPGVGPAIAARIVAHRDAHGPFRALGQLEEVPGVGPKTLARIRPHLRLRAEGPEGGPE